MKLKRMWETHAGYCRLEVPNESKLVRIDTFILGVIRPTVELCKCTRDYRGTAEYLQHIWEALMHMWELQTH